MSEEMAQSNDVTEGATDEHPDPIGEYECDECATAFEITSHGMTKERGLFFCPMCGERLDGPKHNQTLEAF